MIGALSYRYKIPLALCFISLLTTLILLLVFAVSAHRDLHQHLVNLAHDVGSALAPSLLGPLQHDDLWLAYTTLTAARSELDPFFMVLDSRQHVFASNRPRELSLLSRLDQLPTEYRPLHQWLASNPSEYDTLTDHELGLVFTHQPLLQDGVRLGSLIVGYPLSWQEERFRSLAWWGFWSALTITLGIMLLGLWWAQRITRPLIRITDAMDRLEDDTLDIGTLPHGNDELGRLGRRFGNLVQDLRFKRQLEQQIITSERMAAVGRFTAGIAHELNNPLGGMLNALDTYRRHGRQHDLTDKTLDLIERGLIQIRDILGALLVEVRRDDHVLGPDDIEDVRTLIGTDPQHPAVTMTWHSELDDTLPLPATRVRQILINLLLNARRAAAPDGRVHCHIGEHNRILLIRVDNTGTGLDPELQRHLFEPFASHTSTGLGLWMCYQIVTQLDGTIRAGNYSDGVRFEVRLPLERAS